MKPSSASVEMTFVFGCGGKRKQRQRRDTREGEMMGCCDGANVQVIDPVCGMKVDPAKAAANVEYKGTSFYFCGKGCAVKFGADPEKYLQPKAVPGVAHPAVDASHPVAPAASRTIVEASGVGAASRAVAQGSGPVVE